MDKQPSSALAVFESSSMISGLMMTNALSLTSMTANRLRRREANAFRQVHRIEHVLGESAQRVGDLFDRTRVRAQYRIAEDANVENAHVALFGCAGSEVGADEPPTIFAIRPRSTTNFDSPDLIVTRSSSRFAPPSFDVSRICTTSPMMPPDVTISSPRFSALSDSSCFCRCFCCGR